MTEDTKRGPSWQRVLAVCALAAVVVFLVTEWSRFVADFWPPDRSFIGPNLVASVVQAGAILIVGALLYPPTRRAFERYMHRHVEDIKAHVSAEHAALHKKVDHIIRHHPDIPEFDPKGDPEP
jgi:hypothetical protein